MEKIIEEFNQFRSDLGYKADGIYVEGSKELSAILLVAKKLDENLKETRRLINEVVKLINQR